MSRPQLVSTETSALYVPRTDGTVPVIFPSLLRLQVMGVFPEMDYAGSCHGAFIFSPNTSRTSFTNGPRLKT